MKTGRQQECTTHENMDVTDDRPGIQDVRAGTAGGRIPTYITITAVRPHRGCPLGYLGPSGQAPETQGDSSGDHRKSFRLTPLDREQSTRNPASIFKSATWNKVTSWIGGTDEGEASGKDTKADTVCATPLAMPSPRSGRSEEMDYHERGMQAREEYWWLYQADLDSAWARVERGRWHAAAADRVYDMTYPAYVVRHSREEALQARTDMGELATCALCSGKINPDSPSAVLCASGNNIMHYACGVLAFALPGAPTFNLDCQCLFAEDPAEGETEGPVCVGFSIGEMRAAALNDSERMKEAALQHEMKVNDVLERRAAGGDSRVMVMPNVEAQVIAVIIRGLPAM